VVDLKSLVGNPFKTMFGKKFGSVGSLYQHLTINDEIATSQIKQLPPIWTTINAIIHLFSFSILIRQMAMWPDNIQCNVYYNNISVLDVASIFYSLDRELPNGIKFKITKKHQFTKISDSKLNTKFEIENKIKSMKICGLKQKPRAVRIMCNHNSILELKSCALESIQTNLS
jgi:hypothetical protein